MHPITFLQLQTQCMKATTVAMLPNAYLFIILQIRHSKFLNVAPPMVLLSPAPLFLLPLKSPAMIIPMQSPEPTLVLTFLGLGGSPLPPPHRGLSGPTQSCPLTTFCAQNTPTVVFSLQIKSQIPTTADKALLDLFHPFPTSLSSTLPAPSP